MPRGLQRALLIAAILGGAVLIAALLTSMRPEPPKRPQDQRDPLVETVVLEPLSVNFAIRSQGTVRPLTETVLSAEVSGTITEISPDFVAGAVFDRGDLLLRIDATNYEVAVEQAEALVRQRQIEFDGAEKLRNQGYRAEAELASAAAALASAQAQLVRARRDLERSYIRAPYDGMVRSKETDIGQFVSPGTRLGVVFSTDVAEIRLPLTDQDLAFINMPRAGQTGAGPAVTLSAVRRGERRSWRARIVRSEGVVDELSRVTYAVARIDDPYRRQSSGEPLPMGTFVSASIEGRRMDGVIRVPRSALRGSDQLIFLDDESRIRLRSVGILRADANWVYLADGAVPGEQIVVTALESPVNGMRVRTAASEQNPIVSAEGD